MVTIEQLTDPNHPVVPALAAMLRTFATRLGHKTVYFPKDAQAEIAHHLTNGLIYIAIDQGVPVGAIGGLWVKHPYSGTLVFTERFWYVVPEYRTRGIGDRLLDRLIYEVDAKNATLIMCLAANEKDEFFSEAPLRKRGFRLSEKVLVRGG